MLNDQFIIQNVLISLQMYKLQVSLIKNHKNQIYESGYYADEINATCLKQCRGYIKANEKQCDDGNIIKGDGCDYQNELENMYIIVKGGSIIRLNFLIIQCQIMENPYQRVQVLLKFTLLFDFSNYILLLSLLLMKVFKLKTIQHFINH
ncbi:unnamed protein product [Paramecium pentaurelia]|uniref:Transmembrane protein n=1 Tax=Paramecium pentaurelia TaxID=43138 RepID=A0A8S1SRT6_9CILI|nr:unnamed protein product [Paramecium pentaurelia]